MHVEGLSHGWYVYVYMCTSVGRHHLSVGRKLFQNDPCKQSRRQKDLRGGEKRRGWGREEGRRRGEG